MTRGSQDDSDSTDSEEELDSPARILQQPTPAEKMDVDSNEGKKNTVDSSESVNFKCY